MGSGGMGADGGDMDDDDSWAESLHHGGWQYGWWQQHNHGPDDRWTIVSPDPQHEAWQHEVWHDNINNIDTTDDHWRWSGDENKWCWGSWKREKNGKWTFLEEVD